MLHVCTASVKGNPDIKNCSVQSDSLNGASQSRVYNLLNNTNTWASLNYSI